MSEKVTSFEIKNALAEKHAKREFFITECKTGPTMRGLYIFDGIAIYKSWTRPEIRGYEIKVSRSDFLGDNKFFNYLPYCHELYFVVPKGLIDRTELPNEIGLIYYDPKNGRLLTKKKAIYRKIEINPEMLLYIIMNRIENDYPQFTSNTKEYFQAWVENKINNKELAYQVRNKMTTELKKLESETRKARLCDEYKKELDAVDSVLRRHGKRWYYDRAKAIDELAMENNIPIDLDNLEEQLNEMTAKVRQMKKVREEAIAQ